jgi:hypothetical protein
MPITAACVTNNVGSNLLADKSLFRQLEILAGFFWFCLLLKNQNIFTCFYSFSKTH